MRNILIIIILSNIITAQIDEPQVSPINPDYIKYIESKKNGLFKNINSEGFYNSITPHPTDMNFDISQKYKSNFQLPDVYDLRDLGFVTSIKDQRTCNTCAFFAAYGSLESTLTKKGYGFLDLSEEHARYSHGFINHPCEGGANWKKISAYLLRGDGPMLEEAYPYDENSIELGESLISNWGDISPRIMFTYAESFQNNSDIIKEKIIEDGGVYSSLKWYGSFYDWYNNTDHTFFFNNDENAETDASHAVVLIGWDNYLQTAGGSGAWLAKNSWGTDFGDDGYFYISYQDAFVNSTIASWSSVMDWYGYMNIHYYDELGWLSNLGWSSDTDNTAYALVKFEIPEGETLIGVGTYLNSPEASANIRIFNEFSGEELTEPITEVITITGKSPIIDVRSKSGYKAHFFDLEKIPTHRNPFYILSGYTTPNYSYPIPIEKYIEGGSPVTIENGVFWGSKEVSVGQGKNSGEIITANWTEFGNNIENKERDPTIKIYTIESGWINIEDDTKDPLHLRLIQNYPNPFNPSTTISYSLKKDSEVSVSIYDISGKLITIIQNEYQTQGEHSITWNGTDSSGRKVGGGTYFCQLKAGDFIQTRKMVLLK